VNRKERRSFLEHPSRWHEALFAERRASKDIVTDAAKPIAQADGTVVRATTLACMAERPGTKRARRAVKRLIERYFSALKAQLREQNKAFWAKLKPAPAKPDEQDHRPTEKP